MSRWPKPVLPRFQSRIVVSARGCWIWTGPKIKGGYGIMKVQARPTLAHRLSWQIHRGPIPEKKLVLHHCDYPSCVNPDHLFIGTQSDNMIDMLRKQRGAGRQKLNADQVRSIRSDARSQYKIASDYGITQSNVHCIKARKSWQHVD